MKHPQLHYELYEVNHENTLIADHLYYWDAKYLANLIGGTFEPQSQIRNDLDWDWRSMLFLHSTSGEITLARSDDYCAILLLLLKSKKANPDRCFYPILK